MSNKSQTFPHLSLVLSLYFTWFVSCITFVRVWALVSTGFTLERNNLYL